MIHDRWNFIDYIGLLIVLDVNHRKLIDQRAIKLLLDYYLHFIQHSLLLLFEYEYSFPTKYTLYPTHH